MEIIAIILIILWVGGFSFHILGAFIHIFLILALIVLALRLLGVNI